MSTLSVAGTARTRLATALILAALTSPAQAGWQDWLKEQLEGANSPSESGATNTETPLAALTQGEMVGGLKEALRVGVQRAIALLGKDGGFLNDSQVRIPMPDSLQQVESILRTLRQDKLADEFIETMNHAAERAVPAGAKIFGNAISGMSLEDARGILQGPDDAATRYFQEHTASDLTEAMMPIVQEATDRAGVTSAYKKVLDTVDSQAGFLGGLVDTGSLDVDQYVTGKALDGLFLKLAEEEKRIRQDPVARSTALLKKVFGSLSP